MWNMLSFLCARVGGPGAYSLMISNSVLGVLGAPFLARYRTRGSSVQSALLVFKLLLNVLESRTVLYMLVLAVRGSSTVLKRVRTDYCALDILDSR